MPRSHSFARRLALATLPLMLAAGPAALPAAAQQATSPQAVPGAADGYSQSKLESYAAAVMKVQEIDRAYQPKIQQAQDQQQADAITTEATTQMIGEIEAQGLSVEEYNAITEAAEQDQQLYDRIMTLLAQASR